MRFNLDRDLHFSQCEVEVFEFEFLFQRSSESPVKSVDRYRAVDSEVLLNLQKDIRPPASIEEDPDIPFPAQASGAGPKIQGNPSKFRETPR